MLRWRVWGECGVTFWEKGERDSARVDRVCVCVCVRERESARETERVEGVSERERERENTLR